MFAQRALDTVNQEVINLAREQSIDLMRQIFEALSEDVIKFSWKEPANQAEILTDDFATSRNEHD
jgi:hypothetical protein